MRSNDSERPVAPKSKVAIRSLMHVMFTCAMRWGLTPLETNAFGKYLIRIKDASKKLSATRVLTVTEFHHLLCHRLLQKEPFQTMVVIAMSLGLRCSELLALEWSDIDYQNQTLSITRGIVFDIIDAPKTDSSNASLPLAPEVAEVLRKWKRKAPFKAPDDFIFASPLRGGKLPYRPHNVQQNRIRVAGREMGLGDGIGWHTFRHTYCSMNWALRCVFSKDLCVMPILE